MKLRIDVYKKGRKWNSVFEGSMCFFNKFYEILTNILLLGTITSKKWSQ